MPDTVLEPQPAIIPDQTQTPDNPGRNDIKTRFTPERSQALQAKALAARIAKAQARKQQELERAKQVPEIVQAPDKTPVKPSSDPFVIETLAQVREQMARINSMLKDELDPAKIDKFTSAFSRLSTVEQNLAGRPGPGNLRPTDKPAQGRASLLLGHGPEPSHGQVEQE